MRGGRTRRQALGPWLVGSLVLAVLSGGGSALLCHVMLPASTSSPSRLLPVLARWTWRPRATRLYPRRDRPGKVMEVVGRRTR
jgi:hypothetical protein